MKNSKELTQQVSNLLPETINHISEYGIFTLSSDGIVLTWNKGAYKVQGYAEEEVKDKPFAELYEKEVNKPPGYFQELLNNAKEHGHFEEEGWRQRKNGAYYWSTILITPIYDEHKNLLAFTLISRDLTERKLAAELSEITEASPAHHTSVLATSNITWIRSFDGEFIKPYLQWENFTGQIWPEYRGYGWLQMHPVEEHEKIKKFWKTLQTLDLNKVKDNWEILQQDSINKNLSLKTKLWSKIHQEYRYTITTVVPHFENEILRWLGNEKDIHKQTTNELLLKQAETERLQIEKQRAEDAEAYKRKLEEFIDTLCHEVRNPLTGIYGVAALLQDTVVQLNTLLQKEEKNLNNIVTQEINTIMSKIVEQKTTIEHCANQQKVILNDVLDLSKLESDRLELNPQPFDLKEVLKYVKQIFSAQITAKNLELVWDLPSEDIFLIGDMQRLSQVIINLLSNAIKFTAKGTIHIFAALEILSPSETRLNIGVKDTGIGMTAEEKSRLFQRFLQANVRTTEKYGGSGLGLFISKKLVEKMGGDIQVESEKDQGTEFRFSTLCKILTEQEYLVLQQALHPAVTNINEQLAGKRILITEDNLVNQKILRNYLEKIDCICEIANNGIEALEKIRETKFDLIFMDIEMPIMDGLEATQQIRKQEHSYTPIIGISGGVRPEQKKAALQAGMDACIAKPYQREEIYQITAEYINLTQKKLTFTQDTAVSLTSDDHTTKNVSLPINTNLNYPDRLFSLKKRKADETFANIQRKKVAKPTLELEELLNLFEKYKTLTYANKDYIELVEDNLKNIDIQPKNFLSIHINILQDEINKQEEVAKQMSL